MRFVILGAGAVGGTIGGRLADSGHHVVLLARGAHAHAIREHGLRLAIPERVITARVPVVDDPRALELDDDDVLLLTTKTQQTAAVLDALPRRDLPLVCLQNGVANERMALRRCPNVAAAVVMLPAEHLEPGRVDAQGTPCSGLLDVGRYPEGVDAASEAVAAALAGSGFASRAVPDVMRWKYAKLLRNLGNAVEALTGPESSGGDASRPDGGEAAGIVVDLVRRARAEAEACYRAAGIAWAGDEEWAQRRGRQVEYAPVEGRDRQGGSTWQSLVRGGSVEVDYLNGEITLLGRLHGVPTPVNGTLQWLAAEAARRRDRPGTMHPRELLAAVDRMAG